MVNNIYQLSSILQLTQHCNWLIFGHFRSFVNDCQNPNICQNNLVIQFVNDHIHQEHLRPLWSFWVRRTLRGGRPSQRRLTSGERKYKDHENTNTEVRYKDLPRGLVKYRGITKTLKWKIQIQIQRLTSGFVNTDTKAIGIIDHSVTWYWSKLCWSFREIEVHLVQNNAHAKNASPWSLIIVWNGEMPMSQRDRGPSCRQGVWGGGDGELLFGDKFRHHQI